MFLISRIPSQLIHNKTPFEFLTSEFPDYTQIRTFGCLCYVSTSPKQRHKYEARSKACVFLGYPRGYKGYKLLDLETNKFFISRNVVFNEEIFPCAKNNIYEIPSDLFPSLEHLPSIYSPYTSPSISSPVSSPSPSSTSIIPISSHRAKKISSHLQDYHCYSLQSVFHIPFHHFFPIPNYLLLISLLSITSLKSRVLIHILRLSIAGSGVRLLMLRLGLWNQLTLTILLLYLQGSRQWVVDGYLPWNFLQMVVLRGIKLDWWQRVILNGKNLISHRLFLQLLN